MAFQAATANEQQFTMHAVVDTHRRFTEVSVVYTNNPVWLEHSIHIMELLLAEEKYKVAGFDLKYTCTRVESCPKVVVAHMCMRNHILVYHYCLATRPCKHFASKTHEKDSLVHLAKAITDPYYRDMKDSCNKDKLAWHSAWMEKLDKAHVVYADKEAYTSYEMYTRIVDMRKCLLPQNGQGSSRKQSNGKPHHNKN
ncbi:hypothetical protein D1007_44459 [Hordeum vulgare]|nr:hypothetical protein D1007_44459 [Hordeum vulgare]